LGCLLGVLTLELVLRLVGFAISLADDEHRTSVSDGDRTVLCLGACYTIGLGSEPEEDYPAQLQDLLAQRYPDRPVSVINGGVRGKSIDYFAEHIEFILDETKPQVVVVNINDRLRFRAEELERLDRGPFMWPLRWLKQYSVLARVVVLALEGPPKDTGLPESWWNEAGGEEDALGSEIIELKAAVVASPSDLKLRVALADTYARRSDYVRSVQLMDGLIAQRPAVPKYYLWRAEYRLMNREFVGAWSDLQRLSEDFPGFHDSHWKRVQQDEEEQSWVHRNKGLALYYAAWGKPEIALQMVDEVLRSRPGTAWAHDYQDFLAAVVESRETGSDLDVPDPSADVLFQRISGSEIDAVARYGLFERDGQALSQTENEAAYTFELLLREHLERVVQATEERGVSLIVENMSSRPEQSRIIAEVCRDLGVPLVRLQEGLAEHPDRAALLHPTQSLRLSPEGNSFMAEQLYPSVEAALEADH
jgi:tetratricopeptide (TPR) repeat protein